MDIDALQDELDSMLAEIVRPQVERIGLALPDIQVISPYVNSSEVIIHGLWSLMLVVNDTHSWWVVAELDPGTGEPLYEVDTPFVSFVGALVEVLRRINGTMLLTDEERDHG